MLISSSFLLVLVLLLLLLYILFREGRDQARFWFRAVDER
jgi:hypothetical protein